MSQQTFSPQVSVIIPVRNGLAFIDEAIASALSQSFQDVEIVVIDDGSTDGDYDALSNTDPRIRVLHLAGRGVSARNHGMQVARGELIAFLDADDVWFPGKLAAQVRYMETHPEVGVVFGGFLKWAAGPDGTFAPAAELMTDCSALTRAEPARSGWRTRLLMGLLVGMANNGDGAPLGGAGHRRVQCVDAPGGGLRFLAQGFADGRDARARQGRGALPHSFQQRHAPAGTVLYFVPVTIA